MTTAETTPTTGSILRTRGVGRRFGGVHAVRDVTIDVAYGERRAILGPNGAGKTTMFNLIAGDFPPTSGTVELFGQDVTALPSRARSRIGLARTYQKSRLFLGLTVEDNLYLAVVGRDGGRFRPFRSPSREREIRERARLMADQVWLGHALHTLVGALSHGEQRQLEVGMALISAPQLVMLDEPASGLSRGERGQLTSLLQSLDPAVTLILIEHDMDVALNVAQKVTMMHDGAVIVEGTPDEIRSNETVHALYLGKGNYE